MADFQAIHAVGDALVAHLDAIYPDGLIPDGRPSFELLSTGQLKEAEPVTEPAVTLWLYRVTHNEHVRSLGRRDGVSLDPTPLSFDLHYLLSAWAANARAEHTLLAWAAYQLYRAPLLDRTLLGTRAAWRDDDRVQLVPAELTNEDVMRIWDAVTPSHRLSMSFIARSVRVEPRPTPPARPVVARRFTLGDDVPEPGSEATR